MMEWLKDACSINPLPNGKMRTIFIDNSGLHMLNEDVLNAVEIIRTTLRYFLANTTYLNEQ